MDAPTVKIDDAEITLARNSLTIDHRIEERSIAEFSVVDLGGTAHYLKGQPVLIYDIDDNLIFGGVIDTPEEKRVGTGINHRIYCADWHYLADKRIAAESYDADTLAGDIVKDLITKYLNAEGVTEGTIQNGPTIEQAVINYVPVSQALDVLAEKASFIWYIDENKALQFLDRATNNAPWTATITDIKRDSALLSKGNPLYRNRQYVRGGRALTDEQIETRTGDGDQQSFALGFPVAKEPTVTVAGRGAQTVGIKGLETDKDWYWSKGDIVMTAAIAPENAAEVVFTYVGEFNIITLTTDEADIVSRLTVEGSGSGMVDDIAEDTDADTMAEALETAVSKLRKYVVIGRKFSYHTIRSGIKPGQLQIIDYPILDLNSEEMLIEAMKMRVENSQVIYEITAIQGPELGSWGKFFQQIATTQKTAVDKMTVGDESTLIILVQPQEEWGWNESIVKTPYACPVPATTLYPSTTLYPC